MCRAFWWRTGVWAGCNEAAPACRGALQICGHSLPAWNTEAIFLPGQSHALMWRPCAEKERERAAMRCQLVVQGSDAARTEGYHPDAQENRTLPAFPALLTKMTPCL